MKILVTGANGYIGQGVVKELLVSGNQVVCVDRSVDHICSDAEAFTADIFDISDPYEYFGRPDAVLHLAWRNGFNHNDPCHIAEIPRHHKLLKGFIDAGVSHISCMGTMHEIGYYEGCIGFDTPTNPLSYYGVAKNAVRQLVALDAEATGVKFQWLRGFYIVGNTKDGQSIFSKLMRANGGEQKRFPFTSGKNKYDFLDYEDFCEMVSAAVQQDKYLGIINICSGKPESLLERVERFIADNKLDIYLQCGVYPDRAYDSPAMWGDATTARAIMQMISQKQE